MQSSFHGAVERTFQLLKDTSSSSSVHGRIIDAWYHYQDVTVCILTEVQSDIYLVNNNNG